MLLSLKRQGEPQERRMGKAFALQLPSTLQPEPQSSPCGRCNHA